MDRFAQTASFDLELQVAFGDDAVCAYCGAADIESCIAADSGEGAPQRSSGWGG